LNHHRVDGQTIIERHFEETKPAAGSDLHAVLSAMMSSRFTLLRLGRRELAIDLTHMALASPATVKEALVERFTSPTSA
jgi:hypothetical protein